MMTSLDTRRVTGGSGYQVQTDRPPANNEKKATPVKIKDCDLRAVQDVFVLWGCSGNTLIRSRGFLAVPELGRSRLRSSHPARGLLPMTESRRAKRERVAGS